MIGKIISAVRQARNMSKSELADKSGVSDAFIGFVERGTKNPSVETMRSISSALNIPKGMLFLIRFANKSVIGSSGKSQNENAKRLIRAVRNIEKAETRLKNILADYDLDNASIFK